MGIALTGSLFWLIVAVICGIAEAISLGITSIWFVFGALAAWLLAEMNAPFIVQLIVFIVVSTVLLYYTKPILKGKLNIGKQKTNTDLLIDEVGVVIKKIDTVKGEGQVQIKGQIWSAKTKEEKVIEENEKVKILAIEGVKLVVKKIKEEEI